MTFSRRTYEPLKFLGRLFWVPLRTTSNASLASFTSSWDTEEARWGPTVVVRLPLTPYAVGVGVWLDVDPDSVQMVEEEDAAYDTYVAVNGPVDREKWAVARAEIAALGLDPDEEMDLMQARGVFE